MGCPLHVSLIRMHVNVAVEEEQLVLEHAPTFARRQVIRVVLELQLRLGLHR
jgi:hypothetical protein